MGCEEEASAIIYGRNSFKQDITKDIKEYYCKDCTCLECELCDVGWILQMIKMKG